MGTESFPVGNRSADSWSFNNWSQSALDLGDYFQFMVDMTNYGHLTLSFGERRSGAGIRDFEIHYSTDGTNFTQIPATVTNVTDNPSWRSHSFDLGFESTVDLAIRGKSTVYFRIYGYNAEGSTGTWRIDDVTFNAITNANAITLSSFAANTTGKGQFAPPMFGLIILGAGIFALRRRARI